MATKDGFIIYKSFYGPISVLSDEQLGRLFRAIFEWQIHGDSVEPGQDILVPFKFFVERFKADEEKGAERTDGDIDLTRRNGKLARREKERFISRYIYNGEPCPVDSEALKELEYKDFLQTPYWKSIALFVKDQAGMRCERCGATTGLQVHHKTYEHHGDELHHLDDLICLCKVCHKMAHQAQDAPKKKAESVGGGERKKGHRHPGSCLSLKDILEGER